MDRLEVRGWRRLVAGRRGVRGRGGLPYLVPVGFHRRGWNLATEAAASCGQLASFITPSLLVWLMTYKHKLPHYLTCSYGDTSFLPLASVLHLAALTCVLQHHSPASMEWPYPPARTYLSAHIHAGSAARSCSRCAPAAAPTATSPPPPPCTRPWRCCWRCVTACVCVNNTQQQHAVRSSSSTCMPAAMSRKSAGSTHCCWRWVPACANTW